MKNNSYLPRKTFFWIMGVVVMAIAGLYGLQLALNQTFNHSITEIKVDIAELSTGQGFILDYIKEER